MNKRFYVAWNGDRRQWTYTETERPVSGDVCYDCGVPYSAIGDCSISDKLWEQIQPRSNEPEWKGAGILCPNCILERLHHLKISGVHAILW